MNIIFSTILFLCVFFTPLLECQAFNISSTTTGTLSFIVNDVDIPGVTIVDYLSVGGVVFAQGNKWISADEPGYRLLYVFRPGDGWYNGVSVYYVGERDGVQDMLTIAFTGTEIKVYSNGVLSPCLYSEGFTPTLSGEVVASEYVLSSKISFSPVVLSDAAILQSFDTYKRFGNYGDTIIDKFFNQVFSLMSGQ